MDERRNRVTLCNNGQKTVEIFEKNPQQFDLVLSDLEMPKMTGKQLATALFEIRPNLPIILSSGYSTTMSNDIAKAMGSLAT
jgi:CheY-like chemotaxis protein